jgi:UDP-glucuronate 4-epimerase
MLLETGKPLPIFGDGSTGRDYTYVDDIVAGVLAAMNVDLNAGAGTVPFEIFNLGNSHPVKLNELVELLETATGHKALRHQKSLQPGDVPLTWADVSKAGRLLGYSPSTGIEDGLKRFVAWYRAAAACRV